MKELAVLYLSTVAGFLQIELCCLRASYLMLKGSTTHTFYDITWFLAGIDTSSRSCVIVTLIVRWKETFLYQTARVSKLLNIKASCKQIQIKYCDWFLIENKQTYPFFARQKVKIVKKSLFRPRHALRVPRRLSFTDFRTLSTWS